MLNDLGKELNDWSAKRRKEKGGQEKSLWEELADIGEEFVEALEEVGLTVCCALVVDACMFTLGIALKRPKRPRTSHVMLCVCAC